MEFVNTDRPWIVRIPADEDAIIAAVARETVEAYTLSQDNLDYLIRGFWKHFLTISWIHTNNRGNHSCFQTMFTKRTISQQIL
jgi:hypothetical protein